MSWKRKMQKVVAFMLTAGLLVGLMGSAALADPPPHAKAHGRNKAAVTVKELKDIRGHWAEETLATMNLKGMITGYEDLSFQPSNVVKNIEALAMLVRALGLEEAAQVAELEVDFKQAKNIPDWAKGYIQVALDEGLLTVAELQKFNPNQGMKRAELCRYLVRALKLDLEDGRDFKLDFMDTGDIPEDAKGFVSLLVQNCIMKGSSGNLFQPNKPVTRAEMAVILGRLEGKLSDEDTNQLAGVLSTIDEESITIKTKESIHKLALAENVLVYLEGKKVTVDELEPGYTVRLMIKEDEVVLIRAHRVVVVETTYTGPITQLVLGSEGSVTISEGSKDYTFKVDASTRIRIDGKRGFLMDLEVGQKATITVQGDQAIRIEIDTSVIDNVYEGTLSGLVLGSNPEIKILDVKGNKHSFRVNEETKVRLHGKLASLEKLELGFNVRVTLRANQVISIEAQRPVTDEVYEGTIKGLILGTNPGVTILTDNGKTYSFGVTDETKIYLNDKKVKPEKLKLDVEVKVSAQKDQAMLIEAWEK